MVRFATVVENKWAREIFLFTLLFMITVLNDREGFVNSHALKDGFFVFLILYVHVQFQRFLITPFLIERRYFIYSALAAGSIVLFAIIAYFLDMVIHGVGWYGNIDHQDLFLYYVACCAVSLPMLLLVFFIINFYKQQKKEADNQILLKDMELSLLRSQLNPHFLFNSLNGLYGISLEKPAEVSDKIMQMAQIMRYQLELSKKKYVSLKEDIGFITDYITMEADRVSESCTVKFIKEKGDNDPDHYRIAPLILICFVENAFKHYSAESSKGFIDIYIELEEGVLVLKISNSCTDHDDHPLSTHIGLKNTRKRLEILYPGKYGLNYFKENMRFEVSLRLQLERVAGNN